MKRVFITRRLPSIAAAMLAERFEVEHREENEPYPPERLSMLLDEYDAILTTVSEKFTAAVLRPGRVRILSNYAAGLDNIDLAAASAAGIAVYNTPDIVTNSTADMTFALLLSLIRQIEPAREFVRQGRWKSWNPELFLGEELHGKTFGILGFGKIGQAVARRALGFGLRVIHHGGHAVVDPGLKAQVTEVDYDTLLAESEYLSIHVPLTPQTRGLIGESAFAKMERKPIVLNMARGDVIATADLVAALDAGIVRGAGLDVVTADALSGDHPLCRASNVVVVPHIGTATVDCRRNMAARAARNIIDHLH
jgi:glyoxylate reductase